MPRIAQRQARTRQEQRSETAALSPPPDFIYQEEQDRFALPPDVVAPDGFVYEWKRLTYLGKFDTRHQAQLAANRWLPVPLDRHPELGSDGAPEDNKPLGRFGPRGVQSMAFADCIVRDGQILMERPLEIQNYVKAIEKEKADSQVINQFKRLQVVPDGTLSGVEKKRNVAVQKGRDLAIPEDVE